MATYKVIQDVEAEDKLFGPLTLRQFIYGIVAALFLYLSYLSATHGAAFLLAAFLPIAFLVGFFAFPWGRDQPTEVWALAKIRFMLKPRKRIWNQSGIKELVTITAPKHVQTDYTNGLSQDEVKRRLQALASTIDSRGWAVKNANLTVQAQNPLVMGAPVSDRLVAPTEFPQPVENVDIQASDDILDEQNNADARRLQGMIDQSTKAHHDKIIETMQSKEPPAQNPQSYWFLNQPSVPASIPSNMVTFNTQVVEPGATNSQAAPPEPDEASLLSQLDAKRRVAPVGHLHTIQPLSTQPQMATPPSMPAAQAPALPPVKSAAPLDTNAPAAPADQTATQTPPPVTPAQQAAILKLASNDDLNIATIAREAERSAAQDEVVIKLH